MPGPGRPQVPAEVKEARKLTKEDVDLALSKYLKVELKEIPNMKRDPKMTVNEAIIHSIIVNAIQKGDQQRYSFLLDRLIGKVKDQVEASGSIKVIVEDYSK